MLNRIYNIFNTVSITLWIVVIYIIKERWTFNENIHFLFVGFGMLLITVLLGALGLYLTNFLGKESLERCIEVEQADASFLPTYIGYFLIAFGVSNLYQMFVATIFITIFLYLVRWQYFNVTYLFFGYHCYHVTTSNHTKLFIISRKEIRTAKSLQFADLRRISNTTYIEKVK